MTLKQRKRRTRARRVLHALKERVDYPDIWISNYNGQFYANMDDVKFFLKYHRGRKIEDSKVKTLLTQLDSPDRDDQKLAQMLILELVRTWPNN